MTPRLRKTIDWVVGLTLIVIGVVGGLIPIFQGWVFVIAGLAVLSSHSPLAKRWYDRLKGSVKKVRDKISVRGRAPEAPDDPDSTGSR